MHCKFLSIIAPLKRPGTNMIINDSAEIQHCLLSILQDGLSIWVNRSPEEKRLGLYNIRDLSQRKAFLKDFSIPNIKELLTQIHLIMQTNITIDLPEEFITLCNYFHIKPEAVIQAFVNQLSLPLLHTIDKREEKMAMHFFLEYIQGPDFKSKISSSL